MIGLIYLVKSNEFIGYHPKKGFFQTETLKYLDDDIIWLSNFKNINETKRNIKHEGFFNTKIKDIIYYFNISHIPAEKQFAIILKTYNLVIDIFKEEYSYFNFKTSELLAINNFSELLFKSNLKIIKSPNLNSVKHNFNKEVFFENLSGNKFFMSHFCSADFITELFDLAIPCGEATLIEIEKFTNLKDPFMILETLPRDQGCMIKCKSKEGDPLINSFYKEKIGEAWYTDNELSLIRGKVELEATKIITFTERFRLKEVMRTRFKTKYNNFSFEVFVKNLMQSLNNNQLDTLDIWMDAYHKSYYLKKIIKMMDDDIEIGYFSGNNIVFNIEDISKIAYLEDIGLIYPIKLLSYILNN
jgi:hypothetical protein